MMKWQELRLCMQQCAMRVILLCKNEYFSVLHFIVHLRDIEYNTLLQSTVGKPAGMVKIGTWVKQCNWFLAHITETCRNITR